MEVEHAGDAVDSSRCRAPGCASSLSSAVEGKEGGCDPEQESSSTCRSEGSKIFTSEHGELDASASLRASLSPRQGRPPEGSPALSTALGSPTSPSEVSTPVPIAEGGLSAPDLADTKEAGVLAPAVPRLAASPQSARSSAQGARKEGSPASGARTAPAGAESQKGAELPFVPGLQEDLDAAAMRQAAKEASFADEEHLRDVEDDLGISTPPPEELAEGAGAASDADEEPPLAVAGGTRALGESALVEETTPAVAFVNAPAATPTRAPVVEGLAERAPAPCPTAVPSETPEPLPARRASLILDDVPDAALPAVDFYPRKSASPLTRKLEALDRAQWAHIPFEPVPHISRLQRDQGYSAAPSGAIVKTQVSMEDALGTGVVGRSRRQMAHDREAELLAALPSLDALPRHRSSLEIARDAARAQAEPRSVTSGRRPSLLAASEAAAEFPPLEAMPRHRCRLELEMEAAKLSGSKPALRSARGEARHALESELPPLGALPKKHSKLEMEREAFRRASQSAGGNPAAVL